MRGAGYSVPLNTVGLPPQWLRNMPLRVWDPSGTVAEVRLAQIGEQRRGKAGELDASAEVTADPVSKLKLAKGERADRESLVKGDIAEADAVAQRTPTEQAALLQESSAAGGEQLGDVGPGSRGEPGALPQINQPPGGRLPDNVFQTAVRAACGRATAGRAGGPGRGRSLFLRGRGRAVVGTGG
eukprot:COSAG02_NODE_4563_length_5214_cov_17.431085_2_plen_184_part_00